MPFARGALSGMVLAAVVTTGFALPALGSPRGAKPDTLTILATGDAGAFSLRDSDRSVLPERAGWLARERKRGGPLLLVDVGEFWERETFPETRVRLRLLSALGYDAVIPSARSAPGGPDELVAAFRGIRGVRPVSANLRDARGNLLFPPYLELERGGVRIGVTAVLDSVRFRSGAEFPRRPTGRFTVSDPRAALASAIKMLRGRVDLVVVLSDASTGSTLASISGLNGPDVWVAPGESPDHPIGAALLAVEPEPKVLTRMRFPLHGRREHRVATVDTVRTVDPQLRDHAVAGRVAWYREKARDRDFLRAQAQLSGLEYPFVLEALHFGYVEISREQPRRSGNPSAEIKRVRRIEGRLRDADGEEIRFYWEFSREDTLSRPPYSLSWRRPLPLYVSYLQARRPVERTVDVQSGQLQIGSMEESVVIALLRTATDPYLDWEDQDSLEAVVDVVGPPERVPIWVAQAPVEVERSLQLLGLARFLERQAASGLTEAPRYWHRRGLVYLLLECARDGTVGAVRVLENDAWPGAADSSAALARAWRVPVPAEGDREGIPSVRVAAVAVDRMESRLRSKISTSLPPEVRSLLEGGHPGAWFAALVAADSRVSFDDFVDEGPGPFRVHDVSERPAAEELRSKDRLRVLVKSPDSARRLDPLVGLRITSKGEVLGGIACGVRILESVQSGPVWEWSAPGTEVQVASWLDPNRIVLQGWSTVDHPRLAEGQWVAFSVPTVWTVDLGNGALRRFQGAPLPPDAEPLARIGCRKAQEAASPRLVWKD